MANVIEIVSGECEQGTAETYTGKVTARAIKARLTRETHTPGAAGYNGRWAYVIINGQRFGRDTLPSDKGIATLLT